MVVAFIKGYREGFIMSIFSLVSYLAGFFAAMHFSFVIADYITTSFRIPEEYIPIIAFVLLFILVILIVRMIGKLIEKGLGKLLPTVFNRLVGSFLWMVIAVIILSLLYQLGDSADLFTDTAKEGSISVPFLAKTNLIIRDNIGEVIPFLNGLYEQIDEYFRGIADTISAN